MWEYACTYVRTLTHTYACTNPNTQMHIHIHALHAYIGDTHIHAHITHMQTQVVGVGVKKGSVLVEFLKSSMIMCAWMGARLFGHTPTQTLWWSLGYTIRALQQLQNEFLRNYTNCMRYKLMYARIISEGGDWPPKGECFSNVLMGPHVCNSQMWLQMVLPAAAEFDCCKCGGTCWIARGMNSTFLHSFFILDHPLAQIWNVFNGIEYHKKCKIRLSGRCFMRIWAFFPWKSPH